MLYQFLIEATRRNIRNRLLSLFPAESHNRPKQSHYCRNPRDHLKGADPNNYIK